MADLVAGRFLKVLLLNGKLQGELWFLRFKFRQALFAFPQTSDLLTYFGIGVTIRMNIAAELGLFEEMDAVTLRGRVVPSR